MILDGLEVPSISAVLLEAASTAEDPCERAVAEFTVAHLEAMLTLLDAIPSAVEDTA